MNTNTRKTIFFKPLILSVFLIVLDQITKLIILKKIPYINTAPGDIVKVWGDFLWFINVSNKGAMFSLGIGFEGVVRSLMLFILPILLIIFMLFIVVYSSWEKNMRWIVAGIIGGGVGNMIDRLFREDGVVDFISIKFYGLFGMDRWPTFNVADSAIVVSMLLWLGIAFFPSLGKRRVVVKEDCSVKSNIGTSINYEKRTLPLDKNLLKGDKGIK